MSKDREIKVLAYTAEMIDDVVQKNKPVQVGVRPQNDGSRRLLKGKNVRQLPLTGSRGYGR